MAKRSAPVLPITAFVGLNGHGKTLGAVHLFLRRAMARELPILTNIGLDYRKVVPLESWIQLTEFRNGYILLDEINSVLPAREYNSMPAQLVRVTRQFRKSNIRLAWTDPSWEGADVTLRRVTQGVYVCRGVLGDRYERSEGIHPFPFSGKKTGPIDPDSWPPNRLFRWTLYDAKALEEFTLGRAEKIGHKYRVFHWRPGHATHRMYDTSEPVGMLDHLDDTGVCMTCGGTRRRRSCSCKTVTRRPLADFEPCDPSDLPSDPWQVPA